jgi:hypothetical protein
MRERGGSRLLAEKRDHLKDRLIPCHFDTYSITAKKPQLSPRTSD